MKGARDGGGKALRRVAWADAAAPPVLAAAVPRTRWEPDAAACSVCGARFGLFGRHHW